ncbi:MAG TPA: DUF4190 domain-containing protein [Nocardioides sp.]|uniref:DUF4190 domain-containing protein n=1 Tax=Nocardioides sp. TaxID=35761 RepID=UPI002F3E515B
MSYDAPPPPPPSQYGGNPYGGGPYGGPPPGGRGKATASLVCGIVGLLVCGLILGIVAVVLGRQAQSEGQRGGPAKAGEVLGYIDIALWVVVIIIYVATR